MPNRPEHLSIDGERFEAYEDHLGEGWTVRRVVGSRMNLSPYEVEELRDWLTQFLEWNASKTNENR